MACPLDTLLSKQKAWSAFRALAVALLTLACVSETSSALKIRYRAYDHSSGPHARANRLIGQQQQQQQLNPNAALFQFLARITPDHDVEDDEEVQKVDADYDDDDEDKDDPGSSSQGAATWTVETTTTTTTTTKTTSVRPEGLQGYCRTPTGRFRYLPDCHKYVNCWKGGSTVLQSCHPKNLVFDPQSQNCQWPWHDSVKGLCDTQQAPTTPSRPTAIAQPPPVKWTTDFSLPRCSDFAHLGYECVPVEKCVGGEVLDVGGLDQMTQDQINIAMFARMAAKLKVKVEKAATTTKTTTSTMSNQILNQRIYRRLTSSKAAAASKTTTVTTQQRILNVFTPWTKTCPDPSAETCCKNPSKVVGHVSSTAKPSDNNKQTLGQQQRQGQQMTVPKCPSDFSGTLPHPYDCSKFLNCWKGDLPAEEEPVNLGSTKA